MTLFFKHLTWWRNSGPLLGVKIRRRDGEESGQVLVIGLFVAIGLAIVSLSVADIGMMVAEKIHVQDTTDAAAYSAAVAEARYLNLTAYLNRAMIANYDQMAFDTALWATTTAYDHGIAPIVSVIYIIAFVAQAIPIAGPVIAPAVDLAGYGLDKSVHNLAHIATQGLGAVFGQDDTWDQMDFNSYLEIYVTDVLSTYQGLLYAATQAARYRVVEEVAEKMDPEVVTTTVLGLGAETLSADELKQSMDWIIKDADKRLSGMDVVNEAIDRTMGEDTDVNSNSVDSQNYDREPTLSDDEKLVMLGAMTEASLDKLASGRDRSGNENQLRAFNPVNMIGGTVEDIIEGILSVKCIFECLNPFGCSCDPDVSMTLGAKIRDGREDCLEQDHVPVIARQRFREANFFGIDIDLDFITDLAQAVLSFPTRFGYTSGQNKADIENIDNYIELNDFDFDRFIECFMGGMQCNLNTLNYTLSDLTTLSIGTVCTGPAGNDLMDDHWDGSYDAQIACGTRYYNGQVCFSDIADYVSDVCSNQKFSDGVPKYDLRTDLDIVGWGHYMYDESKAPRRPQGTRGGDEHNLYSGPSIAVVGVKPADKVSGIHGLGLGNEYPITAISRAQVYYVRNPNRSDERPSSLNPHWVARLAPIDSDETPELLKEGLPFVSTFGNPVKPTH